MPEAQERAMAYYSHLSRLHAHRPEFQNLSRFSRQGNPRDWAAQSEEAG
jgi:hypothetical protein